MAHSQVEYTGDGSTKDFVFVFDGPSPGYTAQADVKVYVDGVLKTVTTDYTFKDDTTISFVTAPALGAYILIERQSDFTQRPNGQRWNDETALSAANHNLEDDDGLRKAQENKDNRGLPKSRVHGHWDAGGLRGTNAADPINPADWVTLGYLRDYVEGGVSGATSQYYQRYSSSTDPTYPVDGVNREFRIIDDLAVKMTVKHQISAYIDGEWVDHDLFELTTDKYGILFDNAPPCKSVVELVVKTVALTFVEAGTLNPNALALDNGKIIQGNGSNQGAAVALNTIALNSWGAATGSVNFGSQKGINLATPTAATDAAHKGYVDAKLLTSPVGSITSENAYTFASAATRGQVIQNTSGGMALVNINMIISANQGTGRTYELQYADDVTMATNLKRAAPIRITGDGTQPTDSVLGMIPKDKYWSLAITSGPSHPASGITFEYQLGVNV